MAKPKKENQKDYTSSSLFVKDLPGVSFSTLESQIDTINNSGVVSYKFKNPKRAESVRIILNEVNNVDSLFVDGVLNKVFETKNKGRYATDLYGVAQDSAAIRIVKRDLSKPVRLELQNIYHGFVEDIPIPDNALWRHPSTRIIYQLNF